MAQVVSCQLATADDRVQSHFSSCGVGNRQRGTGAG